MPSAARKKVAAAGTPAASRRPSHLERIKVIEDMILHVRRIRLHLRSVHTLRVEMDNPKDGPKDAVAKRSKLLANSEKFAQLEQTYHHLWSDTVFPWVEMEMPETVRAMHLQGRLPSFQFGDVALMQQSLEDLAMLRRHLEQKHRQMFRESQTPEPDLAPHLRRLRDCFARTSPDTPLTLAKAAKSLGWSTPAASQAKSELTRQGYRFCQVSRRDGYYLEGFKGRAVR